MSTVSNDEKKLQRKHHWSLFYNVDHFLGIVFTESRLDKKNKNKILFPPNDLKIQADLLILSAQDFNKCWMCCHIKVILFCVDFFYRFFSPCNAFAIHSLTTSKQLFSQTGAVTVWGPRGDSKIGNSASWNGKRMMKRRKMRRRMSCVSSPHQYWSFSSFDVLLAVHYQRF